MSKLIKFEDSTKATMIVECICDGGFDTLTLGQRYEAYVDGDYTRIPNHLNKSRWAGLSEDMGYYELNFKIIKLREAETVLSPTEDNFIGKTVGEALDKGFVFIEGDACENSKGFIYDMAWHKSADFFREEIIIKLMPREENQDYFCEFMLSIKGSGTDYKWVVTKPDGYSKEFHSKGEARDEIIKLGKMS